MPRYAALCAARFVIAFVVAAFGALGFAQANNTQDACKLLSRAQIAKATGLHVAKGKEGPPMAGATGNCWWVAGDGTKIVVTVADASHMQVTMQSQVQAGAEELKGIGTSAVATAGTGETEGGYNISVLDKKGGVAVSIQGSAGTSDKTAALAKVIETHR